MNVLVQYGDNFMNKDPLVPTEIFNSVLYNPQMDT